MSGTGGTRTGTQAGYESAVRERRQEVEAHVDHGHSLAGWAATAVALTGTAVASVAMVFAQVGLFWVGIVVMLLGLPVGYFGAKLGGGRKGHGGHSGHADKGPR